MKAKYNFGARSSSGLAHFLWQRTRRRFAAAFAAQERERGDVPGWVKIFSYLLLNQERFLATLNGFRLHSPKRTFELSHISAV